jgi:hypothetical protein
VIVAATALTPADLAPFADIPEAKAAAMIEDALALAATIAPCLLEPDFAHDGAARAILRGAILRWHEAGTGAMQTQTAGPFGYTLDNRQQRRGLFQPSEIEQLQGLCKGASSGAYAVDTVGVAGPLHADICALRFGALYCSCGAHLTLDLPLWEQAP